MIIRRVTNEDFEDWNRLRLMLWPDACGPEDVEDMREYLTGETRAVFVAEHDNCLVGFLEANLRAYADGCRTRPVGYIEGWYVEQEYRRQGIGAQLVEASEAWARGKGCHEMASDCLLDNDVSLAAHLALGYEEAERLIHFTKHL